jgi:hypothetical protein
MTIGGQARGNDEAAAEMTALFKAIFRIITSTALASPPSATVATVMARIIPSADITTNATKRPDNSTASKQGRQRYDPACL